MCYNLTCDSVKPIFRRAGGVPFRERTESQTSSSHRPASFLTVMLSKSIRPLHNPAINPDMYSRSTPTGIAAEAAAKFANPPPAIVQPAAMTIDQIKIEARSVIKRLDTDLPRLIELMEEVLKRWREIAGTRDLACQEIFGCGRSALRHRIQYWKDKCLCAEASHLTAEEDKQNSLAQIAALPDPTAEEPLPGVVDDNTPYENGETKEDYEDKPKPRTRTASTKADTEAATDKPPVDTTGHPIPQSILKFYQRRHEVQELMTSVSDLRTKIRDLSGQNAKANGHSDPLYAGMGWQHPMENLNALYYQLTECKPDVVCPNCQGTLKDDMDRPCSECRRTGFISSRNWTAKKNSEVKHIAAQVKRHVQACK